MKDVQVILDRLGAIEPLQQQDVGEFSHIKGKMMSITLRSFTAGNWGTVAAMESRGMLGLLQRNMLVINSRTKDIPVLVIQYLSLFGKRLLQVDVLDAMKDKTGGARFTSLGSLVQQAGLADQPMPEEWYTPLQLGGSCSKKGKAEALSALAGDVAAAYLEAARNTRDTNAVEGCVLRLRSLLDKLFDHGGFAYDALRVCLKQEKAEEMYTRWIFGAAPLGSGEIPAPAETEEASAAE